MKVSLNEIEAMSRRASRGAGLPWGLAEEAGKATRWLVAHEFAGLNMLVDILDLHCRTTLSNVSPVFNAGIWQAPSGPLSPLVAGVALCDRAGDLTSGATFVFDSLNWPLAMAPFAATAAKSSGQVIELCWDDVVMILDGEGAVFDRSVFNLGSQITQSARCRCVELEIPRPGKNAGTCTTDPRVWGRLKDYAHRTYAPATEASRLAGAGAGTPDSD